jgi:hypothetical protein
LAAAGKHPLNKDRERNVTEAVSSISEGTEVVETLWLGVWAAAYAGEAKVNVV